ncbi:MAG: cation:proton antiporter [Gammaproteobacteria bacterium]|uniref:Cation:proton antiporter n=1 Tax=Candidatus Thiopontia autotrophica TaxID=2841688 RepID=A0A8J6PAM9_9GAMM|nr:cation:proton antiporter [Candidatus Thiopontia autotrophica]
MNEHLLIHIVLLLAIAVAIVSLSRRLHFPPILGYIVVGIIVGPNGFGWIGQEENIETLAELGIVFLLFTIGLEFSLAQMISMRRQVFGLGAVQVFVTGLLVYAIGYFSGLDTNANIVIASALALSSTAIVIKQLAEQSEIHSRHGRSALGVLIFQDIIAIPLLILIPTLALTSVNDNSLGLALGVAFLKGTLVMIVMHIIGKHLLRPLFHEVASAKSQELFTLTVLTVALGAAALTEQMGLSMTLGAFLAGMMLSETEYKHQVESDIRPFQDILLGLFFVTVGMMISLTLLQQHFWLIIAITIGIILLKGVVLYGVARLFQKQGGVALRMALSLSQVGEFGLVLLTLAFAYKLLPVEIGNILLTSAVLSMSIAPFLIKFNGAIAKKWHKGSYLSNHQDIEKIIIDDNVHLDQHVILCGFGRVGQTVSRFLSKSNKSFIALDMDIKRVQEAHDAGENVYYGDAAKETILKAARLEKARIVIVTFNDFHASIKILKTISQMHQQIPILVRTPDDSHVNELLEAGASEVIPDTFESSIMLASHLMLMIGDPPRKVLREVRAVRKNRYRLLENFYPGEDDNPMAQHQVMTGVFHTVILTEDTFATHKTVGSLGLEQFDITLEAIKRGSIRGDNPSNETRLRVDDHLVLSGVPENIERVELYLTTGKY